MKIPFLFILLMYGFTLFSQNTIIKGKSEEYAGEELVFYTYDDLITYKEKELARCETDNKGNFECTISIDKTIYAFIYLGIYKVIIYLEPNAQYQVLLPPKTPKSTKDLLNPYFEPTEIYFKITNQYQNELNFIIEKFDAIYSDFIDQYADDFYTKYPFRKTDTVIQKLNTLFSKVNNRYFQDYKDYRLAFLKLMAYRMNTSVGTKKYLTDKPALYQNIAYMEFFNQLYKNFFTFYVYSKDGEQLFLDIVQSKSPSEIKKTLSVNMELQNDTLIELVMLKGLYDAFYSGTLLKHKEFPKPQILITLDSIQILSKIEEHKIIAKHILAKAKHLMPGTQRPNFQLYNFDSMSVNLTLFPGKYIYLSFCNTLNHTCIQDFELLQRLSDKGIDELQIITILNDEDYTSAKEFLNVHPYSWIFLYFANQPGVMKDYNIKALPTYYLIDPEGNLALSPAKGPGENFEYFFMNLIKNTKSEEDNELFGKPPKK